MLLAFGLNCTAPIFFLDYLLVNLLNICYYFSTTVRGYPYLELSCVLESCLWWTGRRLCSHTWSHASSTCTSTIENQVKQNYHSFLLMWKWYSEQILTFIMFLLLSICCHFYNISFLGIFLCKKGDTFVKIVMKFSNTLE